MSDWWGSRMQDALLNCEIVSERRLADVGPGDWYFLKLGNKLIPLGEDKRFADMLQFALVRNAQAFERPAHAPQERTPE
ncbi:MULTISPECIES: hypothetical protein [unclassified Bradyrhizobium]|uniref:hypothetical protein n=1 Tax=unclassified Bradyrhizobium TaxID=2631580 RepID=UPI002478F4DF|nr:MULTISPECIES: hypothetical protein [unclassified Bradyrhizobium]WGR74298.1 hypothetical protein MTX24_16370 [Bradyrhizobium sp. ISRA426]WGR79133.1 hypothetical protein MTX21_01485 [Bradyrhizobium sp. ISRA430]WGR90621.1 hypothetical protein MTX25_39630 [Bradyrhizobium sp. ISRA432]